LLAESTRKFSNFPPLPLHNSGVLEAHIAGSANWKLSLAESSTLIQITVGLPLLPPALFKPSPQLMAFSAALWRHNPGLFPLKLRTWRVAPGD
jgi:hypothetical protein